MRNSQLPHSDHGEVSSCIIAPAITAKSEQSPSAMTDDDRLYGPILSGLPAEIRQMIWTATSVHPDQKSWTESPTEAHAVCGHWLDQKLFNLPRSCFLNQQIRHDTIRRSIPHVLMYVMPISEHGMYHMRRTMRDLIKHMPGLETIRLCFPMDLRKSRVNYDGMVDFVQFCYFYADKLELVSGDPYGEYMVRPFGSGSAEQFWLRVGQAAQSAHTSTQVHVDGNPDHGSATTADRVHRLVSDAVHVRHNHSLFWPLRCRIFIDPLSGDSVPSDRDRFRQRWQLAYETLYADRVELEPVHESCSLTKWPDLSAFFTYSPHLWHLGPSSLDVQQQA